MIAGAGQPAGTGAAPDMRLLRALHFADSAFPSGGFAFSWGLETLLAEGRADGRNLRGWIAAELRGRWHQFDRVALAGGFWHSGVALLAWDRIVDESIAAEGARLDSLRAGAALLASARAIGLAVDPAFAEASDDRADAGHFPVVQGHVLAIAGLDLPAALAVSATTAARGLSSAAVRLGRSGAISMQKDLLALMPLIADLAAAPPDRDTLPGSFAPLSDIALMRPAAGRLFVN